MSGSARIPPLGGGHTRIAVWLALATLLVAVLLFLDFLVDPRYAISPTDFDRDLAGAVAVEHGVVPYQTLGDLGDQILGLTIPEKLEDEWVAHSPLSVAAARVLRLLAGEQAPMVADWMGVIAVFSGVGYLVMRGYRDGNLPIWMALAATGLLSAGVGLDVLYLQGASLLAVFLGVTLWLHKSGRRHAALLLLGVAVAWRPWCAPIALFLPGSDKPLADGIRVGSVAILSTLAALPVIGGLASLWAWLFVALPANADQYLTFPWNVSLTGWLGPAGVAVGIGAILALTITVRPKIPPGLRPSLGALATLGFAPLVWPHYWVGLLPVLLPERKSDPALLVSLSAAFLVMARPIAAHSALLDRLGAILAVCFVTAGLVVTVRSQRAAGSAPLSSPRPTEPAVSG